MRLHVHMDIRVYVYMRSYGFVTLCISARARMLMYLRAHVMRAALYV